MDFRTGYFAGNLIIFLPWLLIFINRRDLRKEMIIGGLLSLPLVFTAPWFIPEYWNPAYLFGFIPYTKIGVEDVMFAFFPGSIATVIFEYIENKKLVRYSGKKKVRYLNLTPYLLSILIFVGLDLLFPDYSIYNLMLGCAVGAFVIIFTRRDLFEQSVTSGFLFMLLYFVMFTLFNYILYPGYIDNVYSLNNLSGVIVFQLPLEEYVFSFSLGIFWSGIYEYIFNFRTSKR